MRLQLLAAALTAGLALAAPMAAQAQRGDNQISVRNDSSETLNCRVQRAGRSRFETVVLREGQVWNASDGAGRTIYCDPPAAPIRYRLQVGTDYHIVPQRGSVQVVLRTL